VTSSWHANCGVQHNKVGKVNGGTQFCNWSSYATHASDWNGLWTSAMWQARKTAYRVDRLIAQCTKSNHFSKSARILDELNFADRVSVRTVNRRLNEQHLCARRPIIRPPLSLRHRLFRWNWHVSFSVGIFVIEKESRGQKKVDFYCAPWMAAFESGIRTMQFNSLGVLFF
jgi:hypothetical protein